MIRIEPENNQIGKVYAILFKDPKFLKHYFKSYKDVLLNLEYDEKNDVVKFNQLKFELESKCVSI